MINIMDQNNVVPMDQEDPTALTVPQNDYPVIQLAEMSNFITPVDSDGCFDGMEDFLGSFRRISTIGNRFSFVEAGNKTMYPSLDLYCVILGQGPDNHCSLYNKGYDEVSSENESPLFVWYEKENVPPEVPAQFLGDDKTPPAWRRHRRLVVAVLQGTPTGADCVLDLEHPYILDISTTALYGQDDMNRWIFSYAGLMRLCNRTRVLPMHFVTKISFELIRTSNGRDVNTLRFTPCNRDGHLVYLPMDVQHQVARVATSEEVRNMVKITPKVTSGEQLAAILAKRENTQSTQPVQQAPVAQPVQPVQQVQPTQQAPVAQPVQPVQQAQPVQQVHPTQQAPVAQPVQQAPVSGSGDLMSSLDELLTKAGSYNG